jgi:hypothetical protein
MTTCRQVGSQAPPRWAWFLCYSMLVTWTKTPLVDAARFAATGPVLTITLKDPATSSSSNRSNNDESSPSWGLDLRELHPTLSWSVQSKSKPLPNWLPSLQSIRSSLGYHYQDSHKYIPSNLESEAVFASSRFKGVSLKVQPSYEFRSKRGLLQLQANKGASSYALAQFTSTGKRWLTLLKGCLQIDLPYASVGGIRITPSYDMTRNEPSCTLEATTGSQRTKAIVNLEYRNPTLSIAHTLAEW